ncbi:MAG: hypothetical protein R3E65_11550 [Steroidobacteraceae bacterium]
MSSSAYSRAGADTHRTRHRSRLAQCTRPPRRSRRPDGARRRDAAAAARPARRARGTRAGGRPGQERHAHGLAKGRARRARCRRQDAQPPRRALERPTSRELSDLHYGRACAELLAISLYRINDLKTAKKPPAPALDTLLVAAPSGAAATKVRRGVAQGRALAVGLRTTRDLANLPGNVCTPAHLANTATELAQRYPSLTVDVLDEAAIRREKMGCFLAVAQGSEQPPRFIVLRHDGGRGRKAPIVLVGKGVTFDTGGISLKDPGAMDEMKFDMAGAATVLGMMAVAAELKLPLNIIGLVPAAENMPSGRAIKPGDIVTSAAGLSVEILNTVAEGRLLCDALHYARRYKPRAVIDIAT